MRLSDFIWCLLALGLASVDGVKKKVKKTPAEKSNKPQETTVFERDLVTQDAKASKIIKEFKSYSNTKTKVKNYDGVTLAYLTPWHYDAYTLSATFKHKFTLLSPTWLEVKPLEAGLSLIIGLHNVREEWMKNVREDNDNVMIVPRLTFEGWHPSNFEETFLNEEKLNEFADHLIRVCTKNKFDGLVVEMWKSLFYQRDKDLVHVISHIGERMRAASLLYILVTPPPLGQSLRPAITPDELEELSDYVDYFSLMTYDYSLPDKPGPLSPIPWIRECVNFLVDEKRPKSDEIRRKLLMGMNFYGLLQREGESEGSHIMNGEVYTNMLDRFTPKFKWDETTGEHVGTFVNDEKREVKFWYPTLYSLQKRLELAKELKIGGISIWELGQGLDYFLDLF